MPCKSAGVYNLSIECTYSPGDRTLTVLADGIVSIQDIHQYFERISKDPSVGEIDIEVVELSAQVDFNFRYGETNQLEALYRKMKVAKGIQYTFFVAPTDLQYGMARMLAAIIGNEGTAWAVRERIEIAELIQGEGI